MTSSNKLYATETKLTEGEITESTKNLLKVLQEESGTWLRPMRHYNFMSLWCDLVVFVVGGGVGGRDPAKELRLSFKPAARKSTLVVTVFCDVYKCTSVP